MKILLLGPKCAGIFQFLKASGHEVVCSEENITKIDDKLQKTDFIISFGYQYILKKDFLERFTNRIINLHISYLPWNRGADPNLWSFLEDSPKGVSIHYIEEGIDTGKIIVQKSVEHLPEDTLKKVTIDYRGK